MEKIVFPSHDFEQSLIDSAKGYDNKILVYVDGEDPRTAVAAKGFLKFFSSKLIFLGDKNIIKDNLSQVDLKSDNIEIIEPSASDRFEDYQKVLMKRFNEREKDITEADAHKLVSRSNYYAAIMLKTGDAHGGVSGSISSTEDMMRPLIQIIGTGTPKKYLSGACIQIVPDRSYGLDGKFLFSDIAVIPFPNEAQMIDIVMESYQTARILFDGEPKIALLSYSTKGSATGENIEQIRNVVDRVKEINPSILIDGELQFDAAVVPGVAQAKGWKSDITGEANILIFPNLDSANICIKAVHRFAKTKYYGTLIQGAPIPFNDLSRGCAPVEILTMSIMTLLQIKEKNSR
jgi:phosphate acetyltransferase